jgi:hypothetical protein
MRRIALVVVFAGAACNVTGTFVCATADQCRRGGGEVGHCEVSGFCSFDDLDCPSQHRYDPSASTALAGKCVDDLVTGRLGQRYATNDAAFMPTVMDYVYPPASVVMAVRLDDGTTSAVSYSDDGTFSFPLATPGQTYALAITAGGDVLAELQHTAAHLELVELAVGRPDRRPVTLPTTIQFQYTNNPGMQAVVTSTGIWSRTPTGQNGAFFDYRWDMSTSLSNLGTIGLLDASQHDVVYLTKELPQNGVGTIAAWASTSFTQTDGVSHVIAGTLTPTVVDQCKHVVAPGADTEARLVGAVPDNYATTLWGWQILAVPSIDRLGPVGGLALATSGGTTTNNIDVMPMFANPYPGTQLIASMTVLRGRAVTAPGATSGMYVANAASVVTGFSGGGTCANDTATLAFTIGVPAIPSIGGTLLDSDDQSLALDLTRPVPMTWSLAGSGPVDYYHVELDEVVVTGTSGTSRFPVRAIDTIATSATIDPSLFEHGHTYIVWVESVRAAPDAAAGILTGTVFPIELAQVWSHSFVVP